MSRLFISYSRQDTTAIDPLAKSLEAAGHTVWIDRSVIEAGSRWQAEIVRGIERADVFLLMLTPASVQSENVERELGLAYVKNRAVLPVMVHQVEVPPRLQYALAGLECIDLSTIEATGAPQRLLHAIASPDVRTRKVYLERSWRDRAKPWLFWAVWVLAFAGLRAAIDENKLWVWMLLSAIAVGGVSAFVWSRSRRTKRSRSLESRGIELTTDFKGFFGQPDPQIVSEWRDAATGRLHEFRSRAIGSELAEFVERKIRVIADPRDLKNYKVDLSFLPRRPRGPLNIPGTRADAGFKQQPSAGSAPSPQHVFVSYAQQDANEVRLLIQRLKEAGHDVRTGEVALQDDQAWQERVVDSIEGSRLFLLVLTPASAASEQICRELELATAKARRIVTVLLHPTVVPAGMDYALVGIQSVDLSVNFEAGVARLLEMLGARRANQEFAPASAGTTSPLSDWFADRIEDLYRATIGRLTGRRLQAKGEALLTEYKHIYVKTRDTGDVENGGGIVVEGRIITQWRHPVTRELYAFRSRPLSPNIGAFIKTKTITVYVDRKDMRKYSMDLSFLGEDQKRLSKVQRGRRSKRTVSPQPALERRGHGIYVSYSQQDSGKADLVMRALASKGHEVVNQSDAQVGDEAIQTTIDGARTFLIIVPSSAANDVGEKTKELRFAQASGRKIVPVTFGISEMPPSMQLALTGVQCIVLSQGSEIDMQALLAALTAAPDRPVHAGDQGLPVAPSRTFLQKTNERLTGACLGGLTWAMGASIPVIFSGRGWTVFHMLVAPGASGFVCGCLSGAVLYRRRVSVRKFGPAIWIAGFVIFIFGFELFAYLFSVGDLSNEGMMLADLLGIGTFTLGWLFEGRLSALWLKKKGQLLLTEYRGVRLDPSEIHNDRQYVQVVSEWRDPRTDEVHVFVSKDFSGDPSKRIRSNTIAVFVDPSNMKNYYMDLSYSAQTANDDLVS